MKTLEANSENTVGWFSSVSTNWLSGQLMAIVLAISVSCNIASANESTQQSCQLSEQEIGECLQSIDIEVPVRRLQNNAKALAVPVTVGEQSAYLQLDTESTGLRILAESIDPAQVIRTGELVSGRFGDGTIFEGEVAIASVRIGPVATTEPIAIHLVDAIKCPQFNPECFDAYVRAGMSGVLGLSMNARTGGSSLKIYSPISRLPGNFSSGYIVRTRGFYAVNGRLTLGLTPGNMAGFAFTEVLQRTLPPKTFPDGSAIWQDGALSLDYSLAGNGIPEALQQMSGSTIFDSGSAHIVLAVDRDPSYSVRLWPGAVLHSQLKGGFDWELRSGNTPSSSQIFVRGMPRSPVQVLGLPFFFNFEIAFNLTEGEIGFKQIADSPISLDSQ